MINILDLKENKVTTKLSSYSMVWMAQTGEGKTDSMNRVLRSLSDGDKKPLFIMLEDRYQHIPNIIPVRVRTISELEMVKNQLKNPKAKDMYSCIVIDTADKLDVLVENYVASSKEVEITGDLTFGKGNKYIKNKLFFIDELRNAGWTIHFITQAYKNTNIMTQETTYDIKVNKETWAKISHDAYLIGMLSKDDKSNERFLTFKKTNEHPLLKDSIGMPDKVKVSEFKDVLQKAVLNIEGAEFTDEDTITHVIEDEDFESIKQRGLELGGLLANNGHLDEAMNILKTNIGQDEQGNPKMFDALLPSQIELAKVVVLKLEELINKYNL